MRKISLLILFVLLAGCQSYADYYKDYSARIDAERKVAAQQPKKRTGVGNYAIPLTENPYLLERQQAPLIIPPNLRGVGTINKQIGNTTYSNFDNGEWGISNRLGNQTYSNFSDGTTCITNHYGSNSITNC